MTPRPGAHRARIITAVGTACAVALLLTACAGNHSTPEPWTPSAPPATTPASPAASSDTPDPSIQATVPAASAELYKQAEQLYNLYYTAESSLEADGGAEQLPPQLASVLTGNALRVETAIHQTAKKNGYHWVDGKPTFQTAKMAQLTTDVPNGTVIAMKACEVTAGAKLVEADGTLLFDGGPVMVVHYYFMEHNDQNQLVIYRITGGDKAMATCPF